MTEAARLLRHARKRAGFTQRALAEKAGVPQPYIARVESSRTDPTVGSLSRLLRACETTLEALPGSGEGADRTAMRELVALTPAERLGGATPALRALHDAGVAFVLVGSLAARAHGAPAVTDLPGVCYDRAPGNCDRLAAALTALQARPRDDVPGPLDGRTLRDGGSCTVDTDHGVVALLATPPGTAGYADLAAGADPMDVGGFVVRVVALDDLIRTTRAAGGSEDRTAVEALLALRDELGERS